MASSPHTMRVSETRFEAFCLQAGIPCTRLTEGEEKTADYEIILGGQRTIVEVKEVEANESDIQALRDFREKRSPCWGPNKVGSRIRKKINAAKRQIERLASRKCPGILLLYDTRPPPIGGISPYEIRVAMYGFETIDLHISEEPTAPVHFDTHRFGKGRKLRPDSHTYISAIGVLHETAVAGHLHLDLYHNVYADHPLPLTQIVPRKDITVFTVAPGNGSEFRDWARIVTEEEEKAAGEAPNAPSEPTPSADSSTHQG